MKIALMKKNRNGMMQSSSNPCLTDDKNEVLYLLLEIGLKEIEARLLVNFFMEIDQTSQDIKQISNLNQYLINGGIISLMKCKWIRVSRLITANGRFVKIYSLSKPIEEIIDDIRAALLLSNSPNEMVINIIIYYLTSIKSRFIHQTDGSR